MNTIVRMGFVEPVPGMEEEFEKWFMDQHVEDGTTGMVFHNTAVYKLAEGHPGTTPPRFVAIYEVVGDDLDAAVDQHTQFKSSAARPRPPGQQPWVVLSAGWYTLERLYEQKGGGEVVRRV
jgi:hypothetical protein